MENMAKDSYARSSKKYFVSNIALFIGMAMLLLTCMFTSTKAMAFNIESFYNDNNYKMQGNIWKKKAFIDDLGENFIFLNKTSLYKSRPDGDEVCTNKDIFAYAYRSQPGERPKLLWKMTDFIHDCIASAECTFSNDSPIVTDLNNNGIKEVWLITYLGCRGDVSPLQMKILMYENGKKYALRGLTFLHVDGTDMGGTYKKDPAFDNAPKIFLDFAHKLWQKHKMAEDF